MKIQLDNNSTIFNGDFRDVLSLIEDNSVDMIFADLPYGKTANAWDRVIDFESMWSALNRVCKETAPMVFTASAGFEFDLVNSNRQSFKYKWVWNKNNSCGFATAKYRPLQVTEDILVFSKNGKSPAYYPIKEIRGKERKKGGYSSSDNYNLTPSRSINNEYFPKSLLNISNANQRGKIHPTQKPLSLLDYLIKTYTVEGDLVLDPVMGSGTTVLSCLLNNRRSIGIEKDQEIFELALDRLTDRLSNRNAFD